MHNLQKLSPKYWVVHYKDTDDVVINTASKSRIMAEIKFLEEQSGYDRDTEEFMDWAESFEKDDNLETVLIEIKEVKL